MRLRKDFACERLLRSPFFDDFFCPFCGRTGPPLFDLVEGEPGCVTCPSCDSSHQLKSPSRDRRTCRLADVRFVVRRRSGEP